MMITCAWVLPFRLDYLAEQEAEPPGTRYNNKFVGKMETADMERRFGGLARLYGAQGLERLARAHVVVAGIGGVGSWCVEALARSGVGALTLVDLDQVAESNINRQIHALTETLGQSKVEAMAQRVCGINPNCRLGLVDDFVTPENVGQVLPRDMSLLVDCTDQVNAKVAMILACRGQMHPIVVCGGAGGKTSSLSLRVSDLSAALNDALLAKLRNTLRRRHGYPKAADQAGKMRRRVPKMGVHAVWFDQPALLPDLWRDPQEPVVPAEAPQGLSCAGYGSSVTVTATMGMAAANEALQWLLDGHFTVPHSKPGSARR
jgi:tRNA A37 threonylcarbamoyladenosine dehydratase